MSEFEVSERIREYAERCNPSAYFVPEGMSQADVAYLSARTMERARSAEARAERSWADVCATVDAVMPAGWRRGSFEHTGGGCYALVWRLDVPASDDGEGPAVYVTPDDDVFSADDTPSSIGDDPVFTVGAYEDASCGDAVDCDTVLGFSSMTAQVVRYAVTLTPSR